MRQIRSLFNWLAYNAPSGPKAMPLKPPKLVPTCETTPLVSSRIRFKLVGGDLKVEQGEWKLQALGDGRRTRVFYDNRLAVDWPVPKALIREALRKDTPKVLMNLKRACE